MANQPTQEKADVKPAARRKRGAFPRLPLKSVLELVDAIHTLGHGEPVRRRIAFDEIGRSPESSTSYSLTQAANGGYGLISGGKNATHLSLTEAGSEIAGSTGKDRRRAAVTLLLENDYLSAIVDKFGDRPMPLDSIATDFLERDHSLVEADAEGCWDTAKENIRDFGFSEESQGKQVLLPRAVLIEGLESEVPEQDNESRTSPEVETETKGEKPESTMKLPPAPKGRTVPQIAFNVQVVLPENADAETYDSIFRSISKHLLNSQSDD